MKEIGKGFCACGCGRRPTKYEYDDPKSGKKAGDYRTWIKGHYYAHRRKYVTLNERYVRYKENNRLREKIAKIAMSPGPLKTIEEIRGSLGVERTNWSVSRMLNCEREIRAFYRENVPVLRVKKPQLARPQYERPEIPYELETEIQFLTRMRHILSLDAPIDDREDEFHERVSAPNLAPDELLMMKEDEPERMARRREIENLNRFKESTTPLLRIGDFLKSAA